MTLLTVAGRGERLLTALDERGLDQMIVSDRSNIRWLSGFTGSAGVLLISARGHVLITDGRYTNQAREQLDHAGASLKTLPRGFKICLRKETLTFSFRFEFALADGAPSRRSKNEHLQRVLKTGNRSFAW